ncbi:MAG: electron transport complex subunit RsxG [Rhodospirillaceae bacterium]
MSGNMTSNDNPIKHAVILGGFCLGFGALLAVTYIVTADAIHQRSDEDKRASLDQVIPALLHDNNPLADTLTVPGAEGKPVTVFRATRDRKVTAVAYEIIGSGYAGEVRLMLGVDAEGRVLGVRPLAHKETPGLGDKIEPAKTDWINRFTGLSLGNPPVEKWKVKKDGGQFDQFSGATITPRGVVGAIRGGLAFFAANKARLVEVR